MMETLQTLPQVPSYIPAAPAMVETFAPGYAQTVVAAPQSYIPPAQMQIIEPGFAAPMVVGAPLVENTMAQGQSVIVDQIGDWLVCEDALGVFYHHNPTQQSFDNAPAEFLALAPGYQPPALGAFAAAGYMPTTVGGAQMVMGAAPMMMGAAPQVTYAAAPQVIAPFGTQPQVTYGGVPSYTPLPMQAPMAAPMGAPMVMGAQPQFMQQMPMVGQAPQYMQPQTMMAKVLN
jgi:hypothetical protein